MTSSQRIGRSGTHVAFLCAALMFPLRGHADEPVMMNLEDLGHGTYRLEGRFTVAGSPYNAWKVLTDYEHLSDFVTSLRKSAVEDSNTDGILLEQEALGKEFIFSKRIRVLLQVHEIPYKRIDFEDISHADFKFYEGSWEIHNNAGEMEVVYHLSCERLFVVPNILAKDALKKSAEDLLSEVRNEILRRKEQGGSKSPCGCTP